MMRDVPGRRAPCDWTMRSVPSRAALYRSQARRNCGSYSLLARGVGVVEQIFVGVEHRRAVELEGLFRLHRRVGPLGADVGELGEGVEVLAVGFAAIDFAELGEQRRLVALLFLQVVAAEKLHRARRGLGALPGDQAEGVGERIARRGAERDPPAGGSHSRRGRRGTRRPASTRRARARVRRRTETVAAGSAVKRHRREAAARVRLAARAQRRLGALLPGAAPPCGAGD